MREKYKKIYEQIKSGELKDKISELQVKIDEKTATKEEYKEFKTLQTVLSNESKIDNVIEMKDIFEKEAESIEDEYLRRKNNPSKQKLESEITKLDAEIQKLTKREEDLNAKLKTNLSNDEKAKVEGELAKVRRNIDTNNSKFADTQRKISDIDENKEEKNKYSEMSDKKLEARYNNVKNKSAKCDLVLANLLTGKSWDTIDKKLDGFQNRKFSAKEGIKNRLERKAEEKAKAEAEAEKTETEAEKDNTEANEGRTDTEGTENVSKKDPEAEIGKDEEPDKDEEPAKGEKTGEDEEHAKGEEETALVKQSRFAKMFPTFAKWGRAIKEKFAKLFAKKGKEEPAEEEPVIEETEISVDESAIAKELKEQEMKDKFYEKQAEELITSTGKKFKDQYKVVVDQGMDKTVDDRLSDAKERLAEAKQKAILAQDKKEKEAIDDMIAKGRNIKQKKQSYSQRSGDEDPFER